MERDFSSLLRESGLRVTRPRLAFLAYLSAQKRPVGLQSIAAHLKDANLTTIYRMIEAFLEAGILQGCDVGHGHMDYELADLPHHHHVICTSCGLIEEVEECANDQMLHRQTLRASKKFSSIDAHQATFYGVCKSCK
ncbi:transcriptional repressor [bacterium]|nr:transcriptional repressor [bacterium]